MKLVCSTCLIRYKSQKSYKKNEKYVTKEKRNIDIDGNNLDRIFYFICMACKQVNKINHAYTFWK